ncbi:MAG: hypothetical protein UU05_C0008G0012 [Candidatus Curtissbacteria bacterium GW2011_GWA1_40_47]|nr:MAG: hypothetical protein UU05_C0008G0012 [Candidatus Curtissbacteria bacterium GW2011_GWA1_40_47]
MLGDFYNLKDGFALGGLDFDSFAKFSAKKRAAYWGTGGNFTSGWVCFQLLNYRKLLT